MARTLLFTDIHKTSLSPIVVQHPFTSSGFNMVMINGEPKCVDITADSEALHHWRKMVCAQIDSSKSAFEIYMMTNKPYGMTFLKYAAHHLSKQDFSQILADAWIRSENPNNDPNLSQSKLLSMFQSAEPRHLMSQDELNTLDELDATVTVYLSKILSKEDTAQITLLPRCLPIVSRYDSTSDLIITCLSFPASMFAINTSYGFRGFTYFI